MRSLALLVLVVGVLSSGVRLCAAPTSHLPPTYTSLESQKDLDSAITLLRGWERRRPMAQGLEVARAKQALAELNLAWDGLEGRRVEIQGVLLDFLGRSLRIEGELRDVGSSMPAGEQELRDRTNAILRRCLPGYRTWLTHEVLLREEAQPLDRRIAACEVLAGDQDSGAVLALFASTCSSSERLVDAAIGALVGRDSPEVHRRLIDLLRSSEEGKVRLWRAPIEAHFRSRTLPEEQPKPIERVQGYVAAALSSGDWRRASRGISIAHCLPHSAAFPSLIAGLETWIQLGEDENRPVRRVQGEIEAELERRSGRHLGLHPERWQAHFEAYLRGAVTLVGADGSGGNITRAVFFGLRPVTDRVVFVLDRSGSMEADFGTEKGHSRLDEATDQMASFLEQLGERTRFNVVIFSDDSASWKSKLRPATTSNIKAARAWVHRNGPNGGTNLATGVREAMELNRKGELDLTALEADTVIVLCDGATAEGPSWVEPLLRRVNDEARLVFHSVQIGSGGDGTLQLLAEQTGGKFVRVGN